VAQASVYTTHNSAVRTGPLNKAVCAPSLKAKWPVCQAVVFFIIVYACASARAILHALFQYLQYYLHFILSTLHLIFLKQSRV
jgi:hypothetical protein